MKSERKRLETRKRPALPQVDVTDAGRMDRLTVPEKRKSKYGRSEHQVDRDNILYASAFRRLAGVTQVASSGEGPIFHNRLTHCLKVAQIGRRMAERLLRCTSPEIVAI